jgi:hypothetical protein
MNNEQQTMLSQDERQHIRAEMIFRDEVRRELKLTESPAKQEPSWRRRVDPFFDLLSKPFFITLIFSLIAGLITFEVQKKAALKEKERAYLQALQERKFQLLSSFDASFNNSFSSLLWYEHKLNWVNSYKDRSVYPKGPEAFPGGVVEFNKAMDDLEAKWKDVSALPTYEGLFAQVEALFDSSEVQDRLKELREAVKKSKTMQLSSAADVSNIQNLVKPKVEALLSAMGYEIKGTTQAH